MRVLKVSTATVLFALAAPIAFAQPAPTGDTTFVGGTRGSPGCPAVKLHILRADTVLSGVVFYADGSGVSSVKGVTNGKAFSWTQTSISGTGPTGNVTGTISVEGALDIHLVGVNCELKATLPQYNDVLSRGG